jgi:hypothetical protein
MRAPLGPAEVGVGHLAAGPQADAAGAAETGAVTLGAVSGVTVHVQTHVRTVGQILEAAMLLVVILEGAVLGRRVRQDPTLHVPDPFLTVRFLIAQTVPRPNGAYPAEQAAIGQVGENGPAVVPMVDRREGPTTVLAMTGSVMTVPETRTVADGVVPNLTGLERIVRKTLIDVQGMIVLETPDLRLAAHAGMKPHDLIRVRTGEAAVTTGFAPYGPTVLLDPSERPDPSRGLVQRIDSRRTGNGCH